MLTFGSVTELFANLKTVFSTRLLKSIALVLVFSAAPFVSVRDGGADILDFDLWWHLKVGEWIRVHHAFPRVGLFSQFGSDKPWIAYSWGFELLVSTAHSIGGLLGVFVIHVCAQAIITAAIFVMLYRASERFWPSLVLTGLGIWAIYHNFSIRPVLASIFFWTIAFTLILEAQKRQSSRPLYLLPPLFFIWANFHIQFVYGLFLVALFTAVELGKAMAMHLGWMERTDAPKLRVGPVVVIALLCLVATVAGPYGIGPYKVVVGYLHSKSMYSQITELMALSFRSSSHYVQLVLTGAAFFALGRKGRDPFRVLLLIAVTVVAYRTTRDSWFACLPALAMIAAAFAPAESQEKPIKQVWVPAMGVAFGVALVVFALIRNEGIDNHKLQAVVTDFYPVRAAEFVKANQLPGPLYNNLNFGGYLIWSMPEYPVAIDGRGDLYGEQYFDRYYAVLTGEMNPMLDPDLNKANVVLLQRGYPLIDFLYQDPRFRPVFEDENAVVFARR